jgi:XRE family aerobic/anaerobic benzoate catabolism transcriptional regulator
MRDRTSKSGEIEDRRFLAALARRVRRRREARGLTQAELAGRAGLSVRFLARVERGDGNISVVRLNDLAHALGTEAADLLRAPPSGGGFVVLVGLRGAGKSTVGPPLAQRLDLPFVEMDEHIVQAGGLSLDQLFELHGERYYRRLERETLEQLLAENGPCVLAAAGGVVNEATSWRLLLRDTTVVWLRARAEDHWNRVVAQGDRRPMTDHPDAMAELRAMLAAREALYRQAPVQVDTHGVGPDVVVQRTFEALREAGHGDGAVRA